MTNETKRLIAFIILAFAITTAMQALMGTFGLLPRPAKRPAAAAPQQVAQAEPGKEKQGEPPAPAPAPAPAGAQAAPAVAAEPAKVVEVAAKDLVLGSIDKTKGY